LKKFPIEIEIKGSPVVVTPLQSGIDFKGQYPFYNFGSYMRNCNPVIRDIKITNNGPTEMVN
jgi:hypothetical protein